MTDESTYVEIPGPSVEDRALMCRRAPPLPRALFAGQSLEGGARAHTHSGSGRVQLVRTDPRKTVLPPSPAIWPDEGAPFCGTQLLQCLPLATLSYAELRHPLAAARLLYFRNHTDRSNIPP